MNLRKLLCGLLALCLLLTMAPAALMEELEAPVAEVVEELGEVAEAEDLVTEIGRDDDTPDTVKDTDVTMYVDDVRTLTYEYPVDSTETKVEGSAVNVSAQGKSVKLEAVKAGSATVTVALQTGDARKLSLVRTIINVTVIDNSPANLHLYNKDGASDVTGSTVSVKPNTKYELNSRVYSAIDKYNALEYGVAYKKVIWKSSNTKVATIARDKDDLEKVMVTLKKEGTAKITATVAGKKVSGTVTLKVTSDNSKAKKVTINADMTGKTFQTLKDGQNVFPIKNGPMTLCAEVDPADYEYEVDWSVSGGTKYAYFLDGTKKVSSITWTNGNVKEENIAKRRGAIKLYTTGKTGVITITAKVGNKKGTMKVKLFDLNSMNAVNLYADPSHEHKLDGKKISYELTTVNISKPEDYKGPTYEYSAQNNSFNVYGVITNYAGGTLTSKAAITWKSSNTKVATVAKNNFDGMSAKVSLKKTGTTVISMKIKSATGVTKTASFTLKVIDSNAPKAIYFLDEDGIDIGDDSITLKKGQKAGVAVIAEFLDNDVAKLKYDQLKFSTSDKYVAKVDSKTGVITAVGKGTAYIKVKTYNGLTKKLKVVVK